MWTQFFPERASTIANSIDRIFAVELGLAAIFAIPVAILVIYFSARYRRRATRDRFVDVQEGRHSGDTWMLETTWIIVLLVLELTMFSWGARIYFDIYAMPANGMDVYVVAKQWMWKFQHPTGQLEIDELHVPIHYPVRLTMISEDVIHSFFVPAFRVKRDVVPGEYTTVWFEATKTGTFDLFCAEYCGTDHSHMIGRVVVMEAAEYQAWLDERAEGGGTNVVPESAANTGANAGVQTMASTGEQLFQSLGCQSCHHEDGSGAGPSLVGLWGSQVELEGGKTLTADADYVRRSILDPQSELVEGYPPVMPTYSGQVDESQLLNLVEYVQSLGTAQTDDEAGPEEEQE